MRLNIVKSKNAEQLYVIKSYRNSSGKSTSKIVEKLGTLAELSKIHDDPIAWAKEYIVIKGCSGYCCIDEAFEDKATITADSNFALSLLLASNSRYKPLESLSGCSVITAEHCHAHRTQEYFPAGIRQCHSLSHRLRRLLPLSLPLPLLRGSLPLLLFLSHFRNRPFSSF